MNYIWLIIHRRDFSFINDGKNQVKYTVRYHLKPVLAGCGFTALLCVTSACTVCVKPFWKIVFYYPVKLNIDKPYNPVIYL